jgi:hypothetical protein
VSWPLVEHNPAGLTHDEHCGEVVDRPEAADDRADAMAEGDTSGPPR